MTGKKRRWKKILGFSFLGVLVLSLVFVAWVNSKYEFEPTFLAEFGFTKVRKYTDHDWTTEIYESSVSIGQVEAAVIKEMKERGYEVAVTRLPQYVRFQFHRAGWNRADLSSYTPDRKTVFSYYTTTLLHQRAMTVMRIERIELR